MGIVSSYVLSDQSTWAFKLVLGFCYLPFFLCSCWCCVLWLSAVHKSNHQRPKPGSRLQLENPAFLCCTWAPVDEAPETRHSRNSWLDVWSCISSSSARLAMCLSSPCTCFSQRARVISGSGAAVQGEKKLLDHYCHSLIVLQRKADVKDWVLALLFSFLTCP